MTCIAGHCSATVFRRYLEAAADTIAVHRSHHTRSGRADSDYCVDTDYCKGPAPPRPRYCPGTTVFCFGTAVRSVPVTKTETIGSLRSLFTDGPVGRKHVRPDWLGLAKVHLRLQLKDCDISQTRKQPGIGCEEILLMKSVP